MLKKVILPSGYHLKEDEDFLYLCYHNERIAYFSPYGADPLEIMKSVEEHQKAPCRCKNCSNCSDSNKTD